MVSCDTCGQRTHERSLVAVNGGFHCPQCAPGLADLGDEIGSVYTAAEHQNATETAQNQSVWVAQYESPRFQFMAVGLNAKFALDSLVNGLQDHATQYDLWGDWFDGDDITLTRMELGQTLRDREVIHV